MAIGAALAGAAISAGSGLIGNIMNHDIAKQNLALQRDQYEYQKQLNAQTMAREDNAHQREVADLIQSGLSPLQSSGSGASSQSFSSAPAPQNNFRVSPIDMLQLGTVVANARKADAEAVLMEKEAGVFDETHQAEMDLKKAGIEKSEAEINNIVARTITENSLRPLEISLRSNDLKRFNLDMSMLSQRLANEIQRGANLREEEKRIVQDTAYALIQTKLAEKELKYAGFNNVAGGISKLLGSVAGLGAGIFGAGKGISVLRALTGRGAPIGFH